jgi:hypothetical protein
VVHVTIPSRQGANFLYITVGGIYSNHWALKGVYAVAQLIKEMYYKPEGRGFDS